MWQSSGRHARLSLRHFTCQTPQRDDEYCLVLVYLWWKKDSSVQACVCVWVYLRKTVSIENPPSMLRHGCSPFASWSGSCVRDTCAPSRPRHTSTQRAHMLAPLAAKSFTLIGLCLLSIGNQTGNEPSLRSSPVCDTRLTNVSKLQIMSLV